VLPNVGRYYSSLQKTEGFKKLEERTNQDNRPNVLFE
jgi:hypothetical protein